MKPQTYKSTDPDIEQPLTREQALHEEFEVEARCQGVLAIAVKDEFYRHPGGDLAAMINENISYRMVEIVD